MGGITMEDGTIHVPRPGGEVVSDLHGVRTTWAALDVEDHLECLLTTGRRDLRQRRENSSGREDR